MSAAVKVPWGWAFRSACAALPNAAVFTAAPQGDGGYISVACRSASASAGCVGSAVPKWDAVR